MGYLYRLVLDNRLFYLFLSKNPHLQYLLIKFFTSIQDMGCFKKIECLIDLINEIFSFSIRE